jgi:(1->4)-alpha-D-glucan 1-alpha-D-glucosylmutase
VTGAPPPVPPSPPSPPSPPTATYRFQLTPDNGFAALAARAGYLDRLGVSHAYVSPVLQAAPGSMHGYDVVDHGRIDEELGGEDGFRAAVAALQSDGLGLVVDVVPNHMAIPVPEHLNRMLWSVLRDGVESRYASWLDVDWSLERPILMPVLGRQLDECLESGEITVDLVGGPDGTPVVRYFDHVLPVRAGTQGLPIEDLLAAQHYRLAFWREADKELNYRRFFDIATLVGVRVEVPEVFNASHALLVRLVREGLVQGLRIDHPDGLADPRGYLRRLAEVTEGAWVVVEKILEPGEDLPADWPCAGTTGYDALRAVGGLFVDPAGEPVLTAAFAEHAGVTDGWAAVAEQSRRDVLAGSLAAEVDRLAFVAHEVCQDEERLRDHSLHGLTEAVVELLVAAPVYRAYVTPGEPAPQQAVDVLELAAARAVARRPDREPEILLLRDLALGRHGRSPRKDELCVRFQQTTGPAIAKGVEDTASYRWFPLTGLAEVGGAPDLFGVGPEAFHAWAADRLAHWPATLNAMSTHDTKRSEDVRARLATLSEIPAEWVGTVRSWREAVGPLTTQHGQTDGVLEWLLWQTVVGAWPIDADRLTGYLRKAAREARTHTSWTTPDQEYETRVGGYVRRVLEDPALLASISATVDRLQPGFAANVLGQRAVQLFTPGIPDIYQGCESVNLSLVDPDNRRPLDHAALDRALDGLDALGALGGLAPGSDLATAKLALTAYGLRHRRAHPEHVDGAASYAPLVVAGEAAAHAVGFVRAGEVAVVATRLALGLAARGGWRGTTVGLPVGPWRDLLTGRTYDSRRTVDTEQLLSSWPVALLVRK